MHIHTGPYLHLISNPVTVGDPIGGYPAQKWDSYNPRKLDPMYWFGFATFHGISRPIRLRAAVFLVLSCQDWIKVLLEPFNLQLGQLQESIKKLMNMSSKSPWKPMGVWWFCPCWMGPLWVASPPTATPTGQCLPHIPDPISGNTSVACRRVMAIRKWGGLLGGYKWNSNLISFPNSKECHVPGYKVEYLTLRVGLYLMTQWLLKIDFLASWRTNHALDVEEILKTRFSKLL